MLFCLVNQPLSKSLNFDRCLFSNWWSLIPHIRWLSKPLLSDFYRRLSKCVFEFDLFHFPLLKWKHAVVKITWHTFIPYQTWLATLLLALNTVIGCRIFSFFLFVLLLFWWFEHAEELILPWELLNRGSMVSHSDWFVSCGFVYAIVKRFKLSAKGIVFLVFVQVLLTPWLGVAREDVILHFLS